MIEPAKLDPGKTRTPRRRAPAGKAEPAKAEPAKPEAAKAAPPAAPVHAKAEPPKAEAGKAGAPAVPAVPPATLIFAVQPWGEVYVNGKPQRREPADEVAQARARQVQDRGPQHHLRGARREHRPEVARRNHHPATASSDALPHRPSPLAGAFAIGAALAACAPMPPAAPKPAPVAPQITEDTLRVRAREQLAAGVKLYDAGDYDGAHEEPAGLPRPRPAREGRAGPRPQAPRVHPLRLGPRAAVRRPSSASAFEIDPDFALTPAEDGHPIWGPVYRTVRATLIAEREAAAGQAQGVARQGRADARRRAGEVRRRRVRRGAQRSSRRRCKEGLKEKKDQVRALKYSAFCLCLLDRYPACRAEFIKIYDVDPELRPGTPAEAGHPSWTKTFAGAKAQAKRRAGREGQEEGAP